MTASRPDDEYHINLLKILFAVVAIAPLVDGGQKCKIAEQGSPRLLGERHSAVADPRIRIEKSEKVLHRHTNS